MKKTKSFYRNKNILITGGLGFVGSTIAHRLVPLGAKITILDALLPGFGGNWHNISGIRSKVRVVVGDMRDEKLTQKLVRNKEIIFNMAGNLSHVDSMRNPFMDLAINCEATLSLLEACKKKNPKTKIILAGTRNQYGKAQYLPVDEKHPLKPTDINGINCNAQEEYHRLYQDIYGIKFSSLRMSNTYGPRHQMSHPRQGVLNWFIRQTIDGETVSLWGTGRQKRDVNYIDDVVEAFLLCGSSDKVWGEVFNLGGTPIGLKGFVEKIIETNGSGKYKIIPYPEEKKPIEIGDYIADWRKIRKTLGWEPAVSLEEGIERTLTFYRKNKKHYWLKGRIG